MSEDNMSQLINTLKNMMNNNSANNLNSSKDTNFSSDTSSSTTDDISNDSFENNKFNISPEIITNMVNVLKNSKDTTESNNKCQNENSTASLDFETIMKIKSMMDALNKKDDPRSNLLYSLKPYLRKSRQDKLDQYANLFKITQVANIFNLKKGADK